MDCTRRSAIVKMTVTCLGGMRFNPLDRTRYGVLELRRFHHVGEYLDELTG